MGWREGGKEGREEEKGGRSRNKGGRKGAWKSLAIRWMGGWTEERRVGGSRTASLSLDHRGHLLEEWTCQG